MIPGAERFDWREGNARRREALEALLLLVEEAKRACLTAAHGNEADLRTLWLWEAMRKLKEGLWKMHYSLTGYANGDGDPADAATYAACWPVLEALTRPRPDRRGPCRVHRNRRVS